MQASGFTVFGALGFPSYARAERAAVEKARYWLDRIGLIGVQTIRQPSCLTARSAGSRLPAQCAQTLPCSASTNLPQAERERGAEQLATTCAQSVASIRPDSPHRT
jgi:hypothetical protein